MNTYSATLMRPDVHAGEVQRLWRENMSDPRIAAKIPERWAWLYQRNPAGATRTWLGIAPGPDAKIIGCGSLHPRRLALGGAGGAGGAGAAFVGGNLADFTVDKAHRLAGPALTIQRAIVRGAKDAGFDLVYGWPNAKSVAVVKRVGYQTIGTTTTWTKPLRTGGKLGAYLKNELLGKLGAPLLDVALALNDARKLAPHLVRWKIEIRDRADERFDALWQRARHPLLVAEKTSTYLNWRYADYKTESYRFVCLAERGGARRLLGYAVYSVRDGVASIADLFVEDLERHVDPLLTGLALEARRRRARSLLCTYLGTERFTSRLKDLGFFDRGGDRPLIVYVDPGADPALKQAALDAKQWFVFDGELDI